MAPRSIATFGASQRLDRRRGPGGARGLALVDRGGIVEGDQQDVPFLANQGRAHRSHPPSDLRAGRTRLEGETDPSRIAPGSILVQGPSDPGREARPILGSPR